MEFEDGAISFKASVTRLPQKGMPVVIVADQRQREALAAVHGLLTVESFRAEMLVAPWKRHGVRVTGKVEADITQQCVVTLEPLPAHIEEEVEGLFLPEDSKLGRQGFEGGGELHIDLDGPDSPETFAGDTIDVGALAEEFFGLGIDPYPRKPGAGLASEEETPESDAPEGPLQEKLRALMRKE